MAKLTGLFCIYWAGLLTAVASGQTVISVDGNVHTTTALASVVTSAPSIAGAEITVTYQDSSSANFVWQDLGGDLGGVDNSDLLLTVDSNDVFMDPWTFTNRSEPITELDIYLAPGQAVFDIGDNGTPGSGGMGIPFELLAGTDIPFANVTATYSDIVALDGSPPVGDIYARLTVTFSEPLLTDTSIVFRNDLDTAASRIVIPEPSTIALIAACFCGSGFIRRR